MYLSRSSVGIYLYSVFFPWYFTAITLSSSSDLRARPTVSGRKILPCPLDHPRQVILVISPLLCQSFPLRKFSSCFCSVGMFLFTTHSTDFSIVVGVSYQSLLCLETAFSTPLFHLLIYFHIFVYTYSTKWRLCFL